MDKKIKIVNAEQAEDSKFYVCARVGSVPNTMSDNLYGECSNCGHRIMYRPHGPKTPKKICVDCALPYLLEAHKQGELELKTTQQCKDEFELYQALLRLGKGSEN